MPPEEEILLSLFQSRDPHALSRALAREDVDWGRLVAVALEHGVTERLCEALLRGEHPSVPAEVVEASSVYLHDRAESNQPMIAALHDVAQRLEADGIPIIAFKGPALAQSAYGNPAARHWRDLDFLVRKEDFDRCLHVLAGIGYPEDSALSPRQHRAFVNFNGEVLLFGPGGALEPHWAFAPRTLALDIDYSGLWERSIMRDLNGRPIRVLAAEDELLAICLHGCKERWCKLKWVVDVVAFLDRHRALDWPAIQGRSVEWGVARMLRIGLVLARRVSATACGLPEAVVRWCDADETALHLADEAIDAMFASRPVASVFDLNRYHWRMRERLHDRLRYAWRTATQPQSRHFMALHLPDALFFLYYPFKLIHDYLALPLWLAVKSMRHNPVVQR